MYIQLFLGFEVHVGVISSNMKHPEVRKGETKPWKVDALKLGILNYIQR